MKKRCKDCKKEYYSCPARNKVFCSNKCKRNWRKGKTLEEIYGDKAKGMRENLKKINRGKKHTEEWKLKASQRMKGNKFCVGKKHTDGWKLNKSIEMKGNDIGFKKDLITYNKGKSPSSETRKKQRISRIKYIEKIKNKGQPIHPNVGTYEIHILNSLEKLIGFNIIRQYRVAGYFLDGYCPTLNMAIEVDEPKHKYKKERDVERQKNIVNELGCNFFRIELTEGS